MGVELACTRENEHREGERGSGWWTRWRRKGVISVTRSAGAVVMNEMTLFGWMFGGRRLMDWSHAGWVWSVQSTVSRCLSRTSVKLRIASCGAFWVRHISAVAEISAA